MICSKFKDLSLISLNFTLVYLKFILIADSRDLNKFKFKKYFWKMCGI